jgi:hypothetical protein
MNIFETLKKLKLSETSKMKPSYIYLDEKDNQIKVIPLSKLDSAGSALINRTMNYKNVKLIRDSIFSKF